MCADLVDEGGLRGCREVSHIFSGDLAVQDVFGGDVPLVVPEEVREGDGSFGTEEAHGQGVDSVADVPTGDECRRQIGSDQRVAETVPGGGSRNNRSTFDRTGVDPPVLWVLLDELDKDLVQTVLGCPVNPVSHSGLEVTDPEAPQ